MNKEKIAGELVKIAKDLVGAKTPHQKAFDVAEKSITNYLNLIKKEGGSRQLLTKAQKAHDDFVQTFIEADVELR